jgi:Protein of unknown function (DUF3108)
VRRRSVAALSFAVAVAFAATAEEPAKRPLPYVQRILTEGETLDFTLTWLKIVGGSARMTLAPAGSRLQITSSARSAPIFDKIYPVRDEIESVVSAGTFSTIRFHKILSEGSHSREELTVIDHERGIGIRKGTEFPVPAEVFDPLSIIYQLRTVDLSAGKVHTFNMLADGKIYDVEVRVTGREVVKTEAGTFRTVVVEPRMQHGGIFRDENSRLTIWYTDDDRRIPVIIRSVVKHGTITATLRAAALGVRRQE